MDILIYAKPEIIEHKMEDVFSKKHSNGFCYWTVSKRPSIENHKKINFVRFSDGIKIYAEGKFLGTAGYKGESIQIRFTPLIRVNLKQPKKPPTRGWCYINRKDNDN